MMIPLYIGIKSISSHQRKTLTRCYFRAGWRVEYRVKNGFRKVHRLVSGRKAAPQVIASEQQTAPGKEDLSKQDTLKLLIEYRLCSEFIEMEYVTVEDIRYEYDSPEDPPDYEYYGPPEEPLPVYKR